MSNLDDKEYDIVARDLFSTQAMINSLVILRIKTCVLIIYSISWMGDAVCLHCVDENQLLQLLLRMNFLSCVSCSEQLGDILLLESID